MERDLPYGHQSIDDSDIAAVVEVLRSEWLTTGPTVARFEEELEALVRAPCAALSSGTAALHAGYTALELAKEDVVLTSPLTFAATASTALVAGASVELADVDPSSLTISVEELRKRIHPGVKVVACVDFGGTPANLNGVLEVAHAHDAVVLEDASHSIGGLYRGAPIGSIADITTFSFHPVKVITTGEGGAVASKDARILERVRAFRNHGLQKPPRGDGPWHQEVAEPGLNYRLSDIHAALGISQLRRLRSFKETRGHLVERYRELLASVDEVRLQRSVDGADPAWHLFVVRVPAHLRARVYDHLRSRGINTQVHYLPLHLHPGLAGLGYVRGDFPEAEKAYEEMLSLPLFPGLSEEDQIRVVEELKIGLVSGA